MGTRSQIEVHTASGDYPVLIGDELVGNPELWRPFIRGAQVLVVTNETVAPLYLDTVLSGLESLQTDTMILPDGEQYKTLTTVNGIWDRLVGLRFERDSTLLALGGGVISDLTGFAAACYRRGVRFIPMPTTLLAQVDASIGGKTGVNHPKGKNLIGSFHQPCAVISDTATLKTLPRRELRAGLAEVIKYGLIRDADFAAWLDDNLPRVLELDPGALAHAVNRCCHNKAAIVAEDERETGIRTLLNFGHTFAHAVETATGYRSWLHGEAVGLGMRLAARLSGLLQHLQPDGVKRVEAVLDAAGLPATLPAELDPDTCIQLMQGDKKVQEHRLRMVLLKGIGQAFVTSDVDASRLREVLECAR